ncbi:MAG: nickel pincer cofactor biosynthesis protein LarC [Victivallaceae bacterium]
MRIIRFDSVGGASGDMILGALIGLGIDPAFLQKVLSRLIPEHFHIVAKPKASHGINGIAATVDIHEHHEHAPHKHEHTHSDHHEHEHAHHEHGEHDHHHRAFSDIKKLIENSFLQAEVKTMSVKVFAALAEAEGKVHGVPAEDVHFHEVGAVDSIVDIVGCCLAYHLLKIDGISVSTLPTGIGTFKCNHGIYPLPAPATAELLKNLASAPTDEPYEMVTPTGAALLSVWPKLEISASSRITNSASAFGQRELKNRPNLLRAMLYETDAESKPALMARKLTVLETNLDDCTAEIIGVAFNKLMDSGALDVWTAPIMMKKQRNGILLSVLCEPADKQKFMEIILTETSTFGVREYEITRHCLDRHFEEIETAYGKVRIKVGAYNGREITRSPEIDDCRKLAEQHNVPLKKVYAAASSANTEKQSSV